MADPAPLTFDDLLSAETAGGVVPAPVTSGRAQPLTFHDITNPDSLLPAAPYDAFDAAVHGTTFGLSDAAHAALAAGGRYLRGETPDFDYSQAATEIGRGRDAYAAQNPWTSGLLNLAGGITGGGGAIAKSVMDSGPVLAALKSAIAGGALGGVQGAADNNTSLANALAGAKTGAEVGGGLGAAPVVAGAAVRGLMPGITDAAQTLRGVGVEPTPGSATGGLPSVVENVIGRIPFLGQPINKGRQAALDQFGEALDQNHELFNRGTLNQVLAPVGETLSPTTAIGHDAVNEVADKLHDAYTAAIPTGSFPVTPQASINIQDVLTQAQRSLSPDNFTKFQNAIEDNVLRRVEPLPTNATTPTGMAQQLALGQTGATGQMSGQAFKDAETGLGQMARKYSTGNLSPDERDMGDYFRTAQGHLRDWLADVSPQNADQIRAANSAWRNFLPTQHAAALSPTGEITPKTLLSGAKKFGGDIQYARGTAPMQDIGLNALQQEQALADAGKTLKGAGNYSHGAGIGMGVLGANLVEDLFRHPDPLAIGALSVAYPAMSALYSNAGRRALNSALAMRIPNAEALAPVVAPNIAAQQQPGDFASELRQRLGF